MECEVCGEDCQEKTVVCLSCFEELWGDKHVEGVLEAIRRVVWEYRKEILFKKDVQ